MASARLVVLALFVAGCQSWNLPVVNQGRRAQFYTQQSDGAYQYGYDSAEGLFGEQQADSANEVRGQFGAEGGRTEYTAGVGGFVVTGYKKADAAAVKAYTKTHSAPVRFATLEELSTLPKQVEDTAEVQAAKASFKAAYDAAAAAAEAAPDTDIITGAAPVVTATYSAPAVSAVHSGYLAPAAIVPAGPVVTLDAEGRVEDTAAVKAAKASFHAAYNAAAAAAEAAPDVNIITGAAPVVTATYSAPAVHAVHSAYLAPAAIVPAGPVVTLDGEGRVQDTAEVKAAKASFKAAYDAAAAAAAAAPDTDIITAPVQAPAALYSAPAIAAAQVQPIIAKAKPVEIANVRSSSNADGSYQFSYQASSSSRHESADAANNVNGNFEFVADDAQRRRVDYKAGAETGFIATGAHLPVSVSDTAEVSAAKASFKSAYAAAAAAAAAAPDDPISYSAPVAVAAAAPQALYVAPAARPVISTTYTSSQPAEIANFRSTSNSDGSYQFSYETSDSSRHESADAANNVNGNFEFVADDAQRRRVDYKAGAETGFVATGAHLPVSVSDTAEVSAAKASFKSAYAAAAAAAAAAPDDPISYSAPAAAAAAAPQALYVAPAARPVITSVRYATLEELNTLPKPVQDTAEVKAAKASFKAAYDAAAAAAEAAPDTDIITGGAPVVTATYSAPAAPAIHSAYLAPAATVTLNAEGHLEDTAEVKAAKAAFKAAYDAAAAAAAAAPDTDIITAPAAAVKAQAQAAYSSGSHQTKAAAHHGGMITYTLDDGIIVMAADGALSPLKFGYSFE